METKQINLFDIFTIKPKVLFRASRLLTEPSPFKIAIQVRNLYADAYYEFRDRAGVLFLLIDGVRNVEEAIKLCIKTLAIKDPKFKAAALSFIGDLVSAGLVDKVKEIGPLDVRAPDLKTFITLVKESRKDKTLKKTRDARPIVSKKDLAAIKKARAKFESLLKLKVRIHVRRKSLPSIKIQVFSADAFFPGVKKGITGYGAGFDVESAATSAIGEAIERLFTFSSAADVDESSFNELAQKNIHALDPKTYRFFDPDQYAIQNKEVRNLKGDDPISWTWFEDALKNQKILVPTEINGSDRKYADSLYGETTGSGCALAADPENAKLRALLELIERDNLLFYWRTKNRPQEIKLSRPDDRLRKIVENLGDLKKKVKLYYLKTDLLPTTVQAVFYGDAKKGEPHFVSTSATRMNPVDAIEKSIVELFFVLNGLIKGGSLPLVYYGQCFENSIWEFGDRASLYGWHKLPEAFKFLKTGEGQTMAWDQIPNHESEDRRENLKKLVESFRANDYRLYFKDNTPDDLAKAGFWIYRAFSPDLILIEGWHRFAQLGHARYYTLPEKLGLKKRPSHSNQLNPFPHPLP